MKIISCHITEDGHPVIVVEFSRWFRKNETVVFINMEKSKHEYASIGWRDSQGCSFHGDGSQRRWNAWSVAKIAGELTFWKGGFGTETKISP